MSSSNSSNSNSYDIDSFLDFSGGCSSPPSRSSSTNPTTSQPSTTVPTMAPPHLALPQSFSGPSHQYDLHPQQTGLLPYGSFSGSSSPARTPGGSISLSSDFNFASTSDLDNAFFFPEQASGEFVQPSNIHFGDGEELDIDILAGIKEERSPSNASAMSVASSQPSAPSRGPARKAAASTDPETEMRIRQILEDVKKRAMSSNDSHSQQTTQTLPQLSRMKKDEEDMDEDERLLASDEGKKLSSKERRQLRNKVSARAFRSRRKEYISQLESEVNSKTNENTELRDKLRTVEVENQSLRDLTRMLLASPQFSSFLDQLHPITANNNNNNASTSNVPASTTVKSENITVHRASVPEIQVLDQMNNDFSVPTYIPPNQQYSSFNPRKDTNPNQLQGVEDWPLAYPTSSSAWGNGSAMVFPAEVVPQDIDLEALVGKDDLCPADGFRPGFSSGILSGKEETPVDYSDSYDSNGQYIFTVFEDELEDVPEHLYDYFQIHEPVPAQKDTTPELAPTPTPDLETVIPSLGLEKLFAQLEERFTQDSEPSAEHEQRSATSSPERCRDPELLRTLETLEKTYKRVGVFCGA